jgi:GT2 family glycosyltransferase
MKFSLISPTFGRPEEVTEFLESLLSQNYTDFEVILGDGTPGDTLRPLLKRFEGNSTYPFYVYYEEFVSVSDGRNRAAELAKGDYLIFLDSDCIIPDDYLNKIEKHLEKEDLDLFGGPDAAHKDFTDLQKAISYSMTSIFTTGGIRGKEKHVGEYHPRGFNMGIKRTAFETVEGYSHFRCGEDIELSMRLIKAGYKSGFIAEAFVYHKRRTSLKQFFKQVYRFGAARINIWKRFPEELKATHAFPLVFTLGLIGALLMLFLLPLSWLFAIPFVLVCFYLLAIFLGSLWESKSLYVASLSVITSLTMLSGYGYGFLKNFYAYQVKGMPEGLKL